MRFAIIASLGIAAAACSRNAEVVSTPGGSAALMAGREWTLFSMREQPVNAGRPITLRFDAVEQRAGGLSACNQYSAPYTVTHDSLRFGPIVSTKMACVDADKNKLEQTYFAMLAQVRTYQLTDTILDLTAEGKTIAFFRSR